jgi:4'-phosphopantetheinyl transferase EntD
MIRALLPAVLAVAETRKEIDRPLFPEELGTVERAVSSRRVEFVTARACARAALAELGLGPVAIPSGSRGEPRWPAGIVGSISHCRGFRGCAVARTAEVTTVGIDAEPNEPLPDGLIGDIVSLAERQRLEALTEEAPGVSWDRLTFCIKESVYKAWFPLAGRWLGFEDAELTPHVDGSFDVRLRVEGPIVDGAELTGFTGRWVVRDGLVVTSVVVRAG